MQMVVPADLKVISIVTLAYPASHLHPKNHPGAGATGEPSALP